MEKAFDRVWHTGLIYKLVEQTTLPPSLVRLVASFLNNRKFFVSVEGAESATRCIEAGVPQGSCLSPHLYAVFTNDIPTLEGRVQEWEKDVMLALYADDSAYFTSSRRVDIAARKMQRLLDLLPEWLDRWRMAVNVGKTTAIAINRRIRVPPLLELRGQELAWETTITYLGCKIDRALRMSPQIDHVVRHARAARAKLYPILASKLPTRTKIGIYKTYIRSRLTYAAPAWYALTSAVQRKRLQAQQSLALRMIVGAGRYVSNDVIAKGLRMEPLEEFVVRITRRMFDRADNGPHEHLNNLAPLHARPPEGRPLPREILPPKTPPGCRGAGDER